MRRLLRVLRRRGLSLKGVSIVLLTAITLYATAMMVFLTLQLGRIAADMRQGVEPGRFLYGDVVTRVHVLTGAAFTVNRIYSDGTPIDTSAVSSLRADLTESISEYQFPPLDRLPPETREPIMLAQERANLLLSVVYEAMDLLELGQLEAAGLAVRRMDSLRVLFNAELTQAQVEGIQDLNVRQESLATSSRQALTALGLWLVIGLIGVPLIWIIARQRIWQPLARLEDGLARVAQGDLHVEVSVRRHDEVGRLAKHFNSMTEVLRQRAEEQGRFAAAGELIAGVAHEVNNPLMAIAAMGETRLEDPTLPPEQRAELSHIVRQARRAGRLLSGLLRFVRADTTGLQATDLNAVCLDAVELVSYRFSHEEITLDTMYDRHLASAQGDPARIEQVLVNLLSNALDALQAIDPPRRITIATFQDEEQVCVSVEDNGPGIPSGVRHRLFHPFATTKGKRGTGLGLYISRQIVRDLHGDLVFEGVDRGARFVVSLPLSADEADHALTRSPPYMVPRTGSLAGLRVLLVDDEDGIRIPLAQFLSGRGAEIVQAVDGVEALEKLEQHQVDVILADLKMPRMDGAQLYGELRTRYPELADRTLFLTGDLAQMQEGPLAEANPANVLIKPVKLAEVEGNLLRVWARDEAEPNPA